MERLIELTKRHKRIMDNKNIIVQVYTNASGFLCAMAKVDSGTDLGWSEYNVIARWVVHLQAMKML